MYIVAIGWMYVVTLMAATENSLAAGLATFIFYGLFPCSVLMYILGTKSRRMKRLRAEEVERQLRNAQQEAPAAAPGDGKTSENS